MCKLAFVVACVLFGLKKFWGFELGNDFLFFFLVSKLDLQKREKKMGRVYCVWGLGWLYSFDSFTNCYILKEETPCKRNTLCCLCLVQ